jgi:hypothetical protein
MNCDIDPLSLRCRVCSAAVSSPHVLRNCGGRPGLGDYVASALSAIGITKERVSAFVGRPCGCDGRQAAVNAAGAWLGMPPGSTAGPQIDPPA